MERNDIARLYRELGPVIHRRCLRLLRDREAARDATQEVFVRALRHAPELTWDRGCLPWLYRVATNLCLNRLRDRRPEDGQALEGLAAEGGSGLEGWLEARRQVLALLRQVDPATAQIALHAWMDEMTQDEIAAVMELSRKTVGKRLAALQALARVAAGGPAEKAGQDEEEGSVRGKAGTGGSQEGDSVKVEAGQGEGEEKAAVRGRAQTVQDQAGEAVKGEEGSEEGQGNRRSGS